jgi:MFS family permease
MTSETPTHAVPDNVPGSPDVSVAAAAAEANGSEPTKKVSFGLIIVFALAYMGVFLGLLTPIIVTLPLKLLEFGEQNLPGNISLVLGVGALCALIGNPLFGKLSDRTSSRFGRRKPWLVVGAIGAVAGVVIIAVSPNVWGVLLGWSITQLSLNAALAASVAIIPDQVPINQRGLVSGFLGVGIPVAATVGTSLAAIMPNGTLRLLVPALICAVLLFLLVIVMKDRVIAKGSLPRFTFKEFLSSFYVNPKKARDFSWAWLGRFLLFMGLAILLTYQVPYLLTQLGYSPEEAGPLVAQSVLVQSIAIIVVSLVAGPISDRLGRRKIFVFASALVYAIGLAIIAFAPDFTTFLIGMVVTGAGQGMYLAVDLALVADVLPSHDTAAKDLGVFNIASAAPQSLAPAIAPLFLAINGPDNFVALFTAAAIFAVIGAIAIIPIRKVK